MEMLDRLHDLETLIDTARSMPLSQNALVPREEALALIDAVRDALPDNVREAEMVLRRRDELLAEATRTADLMIDQARAEVEEMRLQGEQSAHQVLADAQRVHARTETEAQQVISEANAQARLMVDSHSVAVAAHDEAARILAEAREKAERLLMETRSRAARSIENAEDAVRSSIDDLNRGVAALRVDLPAFTHDRGSRSSAPATASGVSGRADVPVIGYEAGPADVADADGFFDIDALGGLDGR